LGGREGGGKKEPWTLCFPGLGEKYSVGQQIFESRENGTSGSLSMGEKNRNMAGLKKKTGAPARPGGKKRRRVGGLATPEIAKRKKFRKKRVLRKSGT